MQCSITFRWIGVSAMGLPSDSGYSISNSCWRGIAILHPFSVWLRYSVSDTRRGQPAVQMILPLEGTVGGETPAVPGDARPACRTWDSCRDNGPQLTDGPGVCSLAG